MRKLFIQSLAIAFVVFALLFGLEFFLEWRHAGFPGSEATSWTGVNNAKLVDLLSPMARAYNNVLAMLIATIGLAIPLTANMHTPKLIDMFFSDRINRWMLSFMAFGAAHVLWVDYIIGPKFAPTWAIGLAVGFALAGWAVLIPYFFYVLRFIDPSRLLIRLRDDAARVISRVPTKQKDVQAVRASRNAISVRVGQIGTVIVKSLDRNDRDVAAEGAWVLKGLIDHYDDYKGRMSNDWFVVERGDFVGLSDEALEMLVEAKTWFEMKCLMQLEHGFVHALSKANDAVSTCSDALRVIAMRADERNDEQRLRLCVRFFNNYLRDAIRARNLRAVYDVLQQYRRLGAALVERPTLLAEIATHFSYYAAMARRAGMAFAPQLAVFDLGSITEHAYESKSTAAPALLKELLALPHRTNDDVHSLAVKAKLILGGFLVENQFDSEAVLIRANLSDVTTSVLEVAERELLAAERSFFEVTDRQLNLEYVPPARREPLHRFCESLIWDRTSKFDAPTEGR